MRDLRMCKKAYGNKGFTLVELIVVLIVMCILASVAVLSIVGYIDRSRYNKNEQNAQSIYQAAQQAINRYAYTGEQESWIVKELIPKATANPYVDVNPVKDAAGNVVDNCFNKIDYDNFTLQSNNVGESVHMRYVLTNTKNGTDTQSEALKELLGEYIYDTSIYAAAFSVEFDVEKTIGSDNAIHYSVNVYSVFYDEGRENWDTVAKKISSLVVPYRDEAYREDTSLVGYYNGFNPASVDTVILPQDEDRIEFNELALKNDETLDLVLSAYCGDEQITGSGKYKVHYTASIYDNDKSEKLADLVISEAALTKGMPTSGALVDYFNNLYISNTSSFTDGATDTKNIGGVNYDVLYTKETVYDKDGRKLDRYKATIESTALVYVHKGSGDFDYNSLSYGQLSAEADFYRFPVAISYVMNVDTAGNQKGYVTYTLSLDAMMSREALYYLDQNKTTENYGKTKSASITRLFSDTWSLDNTLAPKNITVAVKAEIDSFSDSTLAAHNESAALEASYSEGALRAYDDPVFRQSDGTFKYDVNAAAKDALAGGFAVVNTYYGDLDEGSFGSKDASGSACITSFRHLYNMRFTEGFTGDVEYTIRRDLNWYEKTTDGRYTSNVRVYGLDSGKTKVDYYSPVGKNAKYSSDITMVLWPALPKVAKKQTLAAGINDISGFTDKTAVIRNVQMRTKSFLSTDTGYGFICENDGTVKNLRCENFRISFDETFDGDSDDANKFNSSVTDVLAKGNYNKKYYNSYKAADSNNLALVPMGGLIGINKGALGESGVDYNENLISMKSCSVFAGLYTSGRWYRIENINDVGGVIGKYTSGSSSYGVISVTGRFAVIGKFRVGGIMGTAEVGIGAYLISDSSLDRENAELVYTNAGSLVHGRTNVGGAIGQMNNSYLAQDVTGATYNYDSSTGVVSVNEASDPKYGIYVKISDDSYVWQYIGTDSDSSDGVGGAIGFCENYTSDKSLSIKSINSGYILAGDKAGRCNNIAGTIGCLKNGEASSINIHAENSGYIGTRNGTDIYSKNCSAAVGIALIDSFGKTGAVYVIDASNTGKLYCNTNKQNINVGVGVAIGASLSAAKPEYYIRAINSGSIFAQDYVDNQTSDTYWKTGTTSDYGVGGAVGYMYAIGCSHIYSSLKDGSSLIANGNNVGGAVGCIRNSAAGYSDTQKLTITSDISSVSAFKATDGSNAGMNVGGCIGNMWCHGSYCDVRTNITGSATITGYKNVGGVIGREQQEGTTTESSVILQGSSGKPTLTLKAAKKDGTLESNNQNVGGAIGVIGTHNSSFNTVIKMPTQTGTDNLVLSINGYQKLGGMAGSVYFSDLQGDSQHYGISTTSFNVVLDSASVINAMGTTKLENNNKFVGGGIGYMEDAVAGNFASNLTVTVNAGAASPVISGYENIGGAIGYAAVPNITGKITSELHSTESVTGTNNIGGAAGYINVSGQTGQFESYLKTEKTIVGTSKTGGCLGCIEGTGTLKQVTVFIGEWNVDGGFTPVYANTSAGGCIGYVKGATVTEAETCVHSSATIVTKNTSFGSDIGGVIGKVDEGATIETVEIYGSTTEGGNTVDIVANLSYEANNIGGFVGFVNKGTVKKATCTLAFDVTGKEKVGGVCGYIDNSGLLETFSSTHSINVTGKKYIGGCVGYLNASTVGISGGECNITKVMSVTATDGNNGNGTGGMIGFINNDGVVNGNVSITLPEGAVISGSYNVGGVFGNIEKGTVNGTVTTIFEGGTVTGTNGGIGGVVGSIMKGSINGEVMSVIKHEYSNTDITDTPVSGLTDAKQSTGKGIGGVIGQMSTDVESLRDNEIYVKKITLVLYNDYKLLSGITSVGGLLGRCETRKGVIDEMEIRSGDGNVRTMVITPRTGNTFDIGGMIGYMLGTVNGNMSISDVDFEVNGQYFVGAMIGNLDGTLGKKDNAPTINVSGKIKVTGQSDGIGGLIGCIGGFNGDGVINSDINLNLSDGSSVSSTGSGNVGGVIGNIGKAGKGSGNHKGSVYGDIKLTMAGTEISGYGNIGGIAGYIKNDSYIDEGCKFSVEVSSGATLATSKVTSKTSSACAGGIVGVNNSVFLADYSLEIKSGTYEITANNGFSGGIMGLNNKVFGRTGAQEYTMPSGAGTLSLVNQNGGKIGLVLGRNVNGAVCGLVVKNGNDYIIADDGSINYKTEINTGDWANNITDKTDTRVGFVGQNNGTIGRVTINAEPEPDPDPEPDGDAGNDGQADGPDDVQNDDQQDVQNDDGDANLNDGENNNVADDENNDVNDNVNNDNENVDVNGGGNDAENNDTGNDAGNGDGENDGDSAEQVNP